MARQSTLSKISARLTSRRVEQFAVGGGFGGDPRVDALNELKGVMSKRRTQLVEDGVSVWDCYRKVGEVRAIVHATAALVASGNVLPMRETSQGEVADNDGRARQALRDLKGPTGGLKLMLRQAAVLMQVAADSNFTMTPIPVVGPDGSTMIDPSTKFPVQSGDWWFEFLSPDEIKEANVGGGWMRKRSESKSPERVDAHVLRMHRPYARFSGDPDSALMSATTICAELILLTDLIHAIAKSRLSAGILVINQDITFGDDHDDIEDDADTEDVVDRFVDRLLEHMATPVENRKSAAALVPLVAMADGGGDASKVMHLVDLGRDIDEWAQGLRNELLSRLVSILEAPREEIEGKGSASQWNGVNIDKNHATKHAAPLGHFVVDWLSEHWYPFWLCAKYGMTEAEAANRKLVFDPSPFTKIVDLPTIMRLLWDREEVSGDALLMACGLDPELVRPSSEEKAERLMRSLAKSAPGTFGETLLDMCGIEFIPPTTQVAESVVDDDDESEDVTPDESQDGPDDQPPTPEEGAAVLDRVALSNRLVGEMAASIDRAAERIGGRIRSASSKASPELRGLIDSHANARLPFEVAPGELVRLGLGSPSELASGQFETFRGRAARLVVAHLVADCGVDASRAVEFGDEVAGRLVSSCEARISARALGMDGGDPAAVWVAEQIDEVAGWSR